MLNFLASMLSTSEVHPEYIHFSFGNYLGTPLIIGDLMTWMMLLHLQ